MATASVNNAALRKGLEVPEVDAFQTHLAPELADGFIGRTDSSDEPSEDLDDRVNDLQFRNHKEWAVGHGVSARVDASKFTVTRIETDWLPRASVLPVEAPARR